MTGTPFERAAETPVTWAVLIFYLTIEMLKLRGEETAAAWMLGGQLEPWLVADGEPWRLLSHAFLHGGLLHLLLNSVALAWIGPSLEQELGSLRFAALYAVAAAGGGLCVVLVDSPLQPVVGGSGALFGMMGAAVALHARAGRDLLEFLESHGPRRLLGLIAVNLALGFFVPFISNAGHVGGLVAGFTLAMVFFRFGRWQARLRLQLACLVAGIGLLAHAVRPVARWDWLQLQAEAAADPERARLLERCAEVSARAAEQLGALRGGLAVSQRAHRR